MERSERRQQRIFYLVAFGLVCLMTVPMIYAYRNGQDLNIFPLAQMLYPALGVFLARHMTSAGSKKLFYPYMVGTLLLIFFILVDMFSPIAMANIAANIIIIVLSIYFIIQCFLINRNDKREIGINGLGLGSIKSGILWIVYFIVASYLIFIIDHLLEGTIDEFLSIITNPFIITAQLLLLPGFLWTSIAFIGEEYGWRYFLQPSLQKKYGMTKGILLVGILWGIWHLPLNLMYYNSIDQRLLSVLNQIITCIGYGIFFGYVYQKTRSVWVVSFIHFMNNNLAVILKGELSVEALQNNVFTWKSTLISIVIMAIFYGWFSLKKEMRNSQFRVPTMAERIAAQENMNEE